MERQVIFRDRQEAVAQDFQNVQVFTDESLQHVVTDAITSERQFVGLEVKAKSATEIEVAPGRLWDGKTGKVYRKDESEVISLFAYLPLQDKKKLSVVAIGNEVETDIQPRDFVIDVQTLQTEPRAVAMEKRREVILSIISGIESPDPQPPAVPTGYLEIAQITLTTSGIEEIVMASNKKLPRLHETKQVVDSISSWKDIAEKKIATLSSDLASLAKRLSRSSNSTIINAIAADEARLKDLMNLPDDFAFYGADNFLDIKESDTENSEYYARVEEGIRFPFAGEYEYQPDLFNPYDPKVKKFSSFIIPTFTDEVRLETKGFAGELMISQYQYQTLEIKEALLSIIRTRYGETRTVCTNAYGYSGDPESFIRNVLRLDHLVNWGVVGGSPGHWFVRYTTYWEDRLDIPYLYPIQTTRSINGALVAQTFLNAQNGWLTKLGLFFTKVGSDGVLNIVITETNKGVPDLSKTLSYTMIEPANMKTYPDETVIPLPRPVFLEGGKRYALILITGGEHKIALVPGQAYTDGTLFYSMDGEYYQGDFTKDIMFKLYYAKFQNTYTICELTPAQLANGIADIDVYLNAIVPESTELIIEVQHAGKWYPLSADSDLRLTGLPAMLPMRLKFIGTTTLQPAVDFAGSKVHVGREATNFTHISKTRVLPSSGLTVEVQVLLEHFDANKHTCSIKLIDSQGTSYTPDLVEDRFDPYGIRRVAIFTSFPDTSYKIKIEGSSTTALQTFLVAERIDLAY